MTRILFPRLYKEIKFKLYYLGIGLFIIYTFYRNLCIHSVNYIHLLLFLDMCTHKVK